jgi:hypothetical protein
MSRFEFVFEKLKNEMRQVLKILIFFTLIHSILWGFEFEATPLRISFFGGVSCSQNVIIYGDFGSYLFSSDLGKNWTQKFVGVFDQIRAVVNYNDTLWGITIQGKLLKSTDCGLSWNIQPLDIDSSELWLNLLVNERGIYLRGLNTLYLLDRNGKVTKILSSPLFKPYRDEFIEGNPDEIYLPVNEYYASMYFYYDKIIFWSDSLKDSCFIVVEPNLENFRIFSISDTLSKGARSWFGLYVKVLDLNDQKILCIAGNLYTSDSNLTQFKYFYKDTTFMRFDTSVSNNLYWGEIGGDPFQYFTNGKSLFVGAKFDSSREVIIDSLRHLEYHLFNLYRVKRYIQNPKDTFILHGTPFKDIYFATYLYPLGGFLFEYEIIHRITPPSLIVNDSIWFFTGRNRFLLFTPDDCKTWNLFSYLSGKPRAILNDSTFFFEMTQGPGITFTGSSVTVISRTTNGGIGFLPSKSYTEGDTVSKGIYGFTSMKFFYIDSTGKGFLKGVSNQKRPLYYTNNFWETFNYTYSDSIAYLFGFSGLSDNSVTASPVNFGNGFLLSSFCCYPNIQEPFRNRISFLDSSMKIGKCLREDTGFGILHILPTDSFGKFTYVCLVNNPTLPQIYWVEIRSTEDTCKTNKILHRTDIENEIVQFYQHTQDSLFFTTSLPDRLYLYDRKTNELKLLWEAEEGDFRPLLMVISDRFYLVGRGLFLENTDRNDLTQWREGEWDYGKPNFESVIFRGNVAIAGLSDSLRPFNYYKITLKKQEPSIVKEPTVEKRYYTTHFWASEPYPQPAKVRVKSGVAWDGSFDLQEAIDGVYDTMGRKVEGKERIRVDARSTTSGELEWECSGVPAGIYFILIRWSGGNETVPVVVE